MNEIKEYSAFIVPSKDGRVIVLARSIKDARLAAKAKELYQALKNIVDGWYDVAPDDEFAGKMCRGFDLVKELRKDVD